MSLLILEHVNLSILIEYTIRETILDSKKQGSVWKKIFFQLNLFLCGPVYSPTYRKSVAGFNPFSLMEKRPFAQQWDSWTHKLIKLKLIFIFVLLKFHIPITQTLDKYQENIRSRRCSIAQGTWDITRSRRAVINLPWLFLTKTQHILTNDNGHLIKRFPSVFSQILRFPFS